MSGFAQINLNYNGTCVSANFWDIATISPLQTEYGINIDDVSCPGQLNPNCIGSSGQMLLWYSPESNIADPRTTIVNFSDNCVSAPNTQLAESDPDANTTNNYELTQFAPFIKHWYFPVLTDPNTPFSPAVKTQNNANIALGYPNGSTGYLEASNLELHALCAGIYNYPELRIQNVDTCWIDYLYVPKSATLILEGPGPVVCKQVLNQGKIEIANDNLMVVADEETHREGMFGNWGTVVGRLQYDVVKDKRPDFVDYGVLFDYLSPVNLEDSIATIFPFLGSIQQENLQNIVDNTPAGFEWNNYLDSISISTNNTTWYWGYNLECTPVKGVRHGVGVDDRIIRKVWRDHRSNITPNLYISGGEDLLAGIDPYELFSDPLSYAISIRSTEYGDNTSNPTTVTLSGTDLILEWEWLSNWNSDDEDPVYLNYTDTLVNIIDNPEWMVHINVYNQLLLPSSLDALYDLDGVDDSYQWYDINADFESDLISPIAAAFPTNTSGTMLWTDQLFTNQQNIGTYYDTPQYLFVADSVSIGQDYSLFGWNESPLASYATNEEFMEATGGLDNSNLDHFPDLGWKYSNNNAYIGGNITAGIDWDTPEPFPWGRWDLTFGSQMTERIIRFTGSPWLNSLSSLDEDPFYPLGPNGELVNKTLTNYDFNEFIEEFESPDFDPTAAVKMSFPMPAAPNTQFVYAPNGYIFEANSWQVCTEANGVLADSLNAISVCMDQNAGGNPIVLSFINGFGELEVFTDSYISSNGWIDEPWDPAFLQLQSNAWSLISNPLMGYLDLDELANGYFDKHPEASVIEFAWYNTQRSNPIELVTQYSGDATPWPFNTLPGDDNWPTDDADLSLLTNESIDSDGTKSFWRRRYYKYNFAGNSSILNEQQYWLSSLVAQYQFTGGIGWSDQAIALANDYEDGVIDIEDGPAYNYLYGGDINPNSYLKMGRYVNPGIGFWVRNYSGTSKQLNVSPDMGVYDTEWPEYTAELFTGSSGPFIPNPNRRPLDSEDPFVGYGDHSQIMCYSYKNDTSYSVNELAVHAFSDEATNGTHQSEDIKTHSTYLPCIYTDSANFAPTNLYKDLGPNNSNPNRLYVPRPNIDGAWIISPFFYQDNNSQESSYLNDLGSEIDNLKMGVKLTDGTTSTKINWLDPQDMLWIYDSEWNNWPIDGEIYWTTLNGDFNGDGLVNVADIVDFLPWLGYCQDDYENWDAIDVYDTDESGCINTSDFLACLSELGRNMGDDLGEFQDIISSQVSPTERLAIEAAYETLPNYNEAGYKYNSSTGEITMPGKLISVYDGKGDLIIQGNNTIIIPDLTYDKALIITTDKTVAYIKPNSVIETSAYNPGSIIHSSSPVPYTANNGSGLINPIEALADNDIAGWTAFYTNYDVSQGLTNPTPNSSLRINQLYYGVNSLNTNGNLHDPNNARTTGFVDMFGAGKASAGPFEFTAGVTGLNDWESKTNEYKSYTGFGTTNIFENKYIPLAYILPKTETANFRSSTSADNNLTISSKIPGGMANLFGKYGSLSSSDLTLPDWGYLDSKRSFDAPLHQGVIAMVDHLTLRDYFKFKLQGVSPKFGQRPSPYTENEYINSFGYNYNLAAANNEQTGHVPAKGWAPSKCGTYASWTTNIIDPFFAVHLGQTCAIANEPAPANQNGSSNNTLENNHYSFLTNSAANALFSSLGPLVYDFNYNGVWDANDVAIWTSITTYWASLGDEGNNSSEYLSANYYRAGTDALNTVVNALSDIPVYEERFEPAANFESYFDINTYPYIDSRIANWANCLDGTTYIDQRNLGAAVTANSFSGTTVVSLFDTPALFETAKSESAPKNGAGAVEIVSYNSIPTGYLAHPSSGFFPTTLIRQ